MGEPADERWAPFPVQDWSTMPVDPPLEPGWAPPAPEQRVPARTPRPWWVPLVVLLCLGLVVGTGTWLARRTAEPRSEALGFVPADGQALWQQLATTRELDTRTTTVVTESARFSGVDGLLSGDAALVTRVLHQDYEDPAGARLWRTTTTDVDEVGVPTQTVRYYRVRGSVELAGQQAGADITAYEPALLELPADVAPGSSWRSAGSAGDEEDYESTFTATAAAGGCLDVSGRLVLRPRGTAQGGRQSTLTRTWCPGRGLVAASESGGSTRTTLDPVAAPAPGARTTAGAPVAWADPRAWRPKTWDTVSVDPTTEEPGPMNGNADVAIDPVLTASGLVVRAMSSPHDLVATTPKTADAWTPAWRVHPGGTVLTLASFGAVVLVTTSERRLVAYSEAGSRLWEADLPEVAPTAPVAVSRDDAVLVDLSGRVLRFGVADGAVRWTRSVGSDVNRLPGVGAGLVVVADRGGTVSALDAATGAPRWDRPVEARAVAVVGEQVVVASDQNVMGLEAAAGTTRWVTHFDGTLTALTAFGGSTLLASKAETLLLDGAGRVTGRLPGYLAVDVTQGHVAGWTADRLDVVDPGARVVATWPTRSTSLVSSDRPGLATPEGVYLFGSTKGWTFDAWTTGG
ncbi:outer membrane protein assembly factor BamB family protein [Microlunatus flavus]|uniref:PQQ-like domain-containing protein n=1 Tax=Microlunatus flavus TaxID=1036181 RepID=A0A1H9I3B5_9ACTN|nr:PQQ-binding-like beta-propeller repeat protein [Microlunatus flavus]SEQ69028.1 PQQ-like domain-containing protein [Microlunatus flavus]